MKSMPCAGNFKSFYTKKLVQTKFDTKVNTANQKEYFTVSKIKHRLLVLILM